MKFLVVDDHALIREALRGVLEVAHDPFDRVLVAQARLEHLPLMSTDDVFEAYEVDVVWAR